MKNVDLRLTIGIVIIAAYVLFYLFFILKMVKEKKQLKKVEEWLLYAVVEAERKLGSGTGELKLRYVYNMFVERFPIAKIVSFGTFRHMVDVALKQMENMLSNNENVVKYVNRKDDE